MSRQRNQKGICRKCSKEFYGRTQIFCSMECKGIRRMWDRKASALKGWENRERKGLERIDLTKMRVHEAVKRWKHVNEIRY